MNKDNEKGSLLMVLASPQKIDANGCHEPLKHLMNIGSFYKFYLCQT